MQLQARFSPGDVHLGLSAAMPGRNWCRKRERAAASFGRFGVGVRPWHSFLSIPAVAEEPGRKQRLSAPRELISAG